MDAKEIAVLLPVAEQAVEVAIRLYKELSANVQDARPIEEVIAEANAKADSIIATAEAEKARAQAAIAGEAPPEA